QLPATPVVARLLLACELLLAHRLQFFLGAIATVGRTALEQLCNDGAIALVALRLKIRSLVRSQIKPAHSIQNHTNSVLRGPLAVGVLDAQDELAAVMTCIQPGEQRSTYTADVQHAGRARGKTGNDSHFVLSRPAT